VAHADFDDDQPGIPVLMSDPHEGADRVGHGEASLGEAQSENPPVDPEMLLDDPEAEDEDDDES
jgi:hypothetical protein